MSSIKLKLFEAVETFVHKRAKIIESIMTSHQKALTSETKSSAGDKHETGRAMLQLEMEKAGQQLASVDQMKAVLAQLNLSSSKVIRLGSLVLTDQAHYFLSISAGEIVIVGQSYYAISPKSPIGTLLLGKKAGDTIHFKKEMLIKKVY